LNGEAQFAIINGVWCFGLLAGFEGLRRA